MGLCGPLILCYNGADRHDPCSSFVDPALSSSGRLYMSNTIRVETEFDSICLLGDRIQAVVDSTEYTYELSSVNTLLHKRKSPATTGCRK